MLVHIKVAAGGKPLESKNMNLKDDANLESTILIVDDDAEYTSLLAFSFQCRGFKTIDARSATEALALLLGGFTGKVAAVLTDLHMNEGSGPDLARAMGLLRSRVPVYFMTGDPGFDSAEAISLGAEGVLYKPFDIGEAVKKIADAIEQRKKSGTNGQNRTA
jgi:DNA-binding NtrC family response regulator